MTGWAVTDIRGTCRPVSPGSWPERAAVREGCSQGGGVGEPLAVWAITDTRGPSRMSNRDSTQIFSATRVFLVPDFTTMGSIAGIAFASAVATASIIFAKRKAVLTEYAHLSLETW